RPHVPRVQPARAATHRLLSLVPPFFFILLALSPFSSRRGRKFAFCASRRLCRFSNANKTMRSSQANDLPIQLQTVSHGDKNKKADENRGPNDARLRHVLTP